MNKNVLDIPKIQKTIRKKHDDFIDSVGKIPQKISADYDYVLARVSSKISTVLDILVMEKIIDKFIACEDNKYRGYNIIKNGFVKSVYIWTDGTDIILKDSNLSIKYGVLEPHLKTIHIEDIDQFNVMDFALELLSYVHIVIYESKASLDVRLFKIQERNN